MTVSPVMLPCLLVADSVEKVFFGWRTKILKTADAFSARGVDGQTVTVTYKGGEKKIDIPANVPVVAVVPASKEDIKPGAIVFVPTVRQSDGSLTSGAVLFGKDGVIPPM